jgi:hypothetical protein
MQVSTDEQQSDVSSRASDAQSNSGFQQVALVAGGYLAVTSFLLQATLAQTDLRRLYALGTWGIFTQLMFALVFRAQMNERRRLLGKPAKKWPFGYEGGDVVLQMLTSLFILFFGLLVIFLGVALGSQFAKAVHVVRFHA